ncbi:nuclear transport factor 2 family protein [Nocardia sp. NPDC006044]|uniref:nuclear transport factor 2 family protein n=1 Tax=Nocardia sp. NPDC006044 TaxID=3364306 RepID=UPI0036984FF9
MLDIQEISDRLEIQELQVAYSTAVDSRDFEALDKVFVPDADIDLTPFGAIAGKLPDIKKWLAESMAYLPASQHLLGNPEIHVDGDRATGRVMCYNAITFPAEDGGEPPIALLGMWYIDEYVRTPQGWRIARRGQHRSWAQGLPTAPAN